jgi:hypothetical protein
VKDQGLEVYSCVLHKTKKSKARSIPGVLAQNSYVWIGATGLLHVLLLGVAGLSPVFNTPVE